MLGVQGYDRGRQNVMEQNQQEARKLAEQAIMNGGDMRGALAKLIGAGDTKSATALGQYQTGANSVFGTPIYGTDNNGNTVIGTFNKSGQFQQIQTPGFQPTPGIKTVDTGTGTAIIDTRTGRPLGGPQGQPGQPMQPGQPSAAQSQSRPGFIPKDIVGTAEQQALGKDRGQAIANLPGIIGKAEEALRVIDQAINHPGRGTATGMSSMIDPRNYIPGTDATNFKVLAKQLEGKTFLEAFESLKGGGQITEVEGAKATQAMARLDRAQSDDEYLNALRDLRGVVSRGMGRAKQKASASPGTGMPRPGEVRDGYRYRGGNPANPESWIKMDLR